MQFFAWVSNSKIYHLVSLNGLCMWMIRYGWGSVQVLKPMCSLESFCGVLFTCVDSQRLNPASFPIKAQSVRTKMGCQLVKKSTSINCSEW